MTAEVVSRTFKQGDQVLLQEHGDFFTVSVTLLHFAELAGDQPAETVTAYDDGTQRITRYEFQREAQVLFATLTRENGRIYRGAELLDPRIAGGPFSLDYKWCGWRVTLDGARPCIVRDGVPPDYVPLGVGDPVSGTAVLVGYDYMRDWGLVRFDDGVYAVFRIDDLILPEPTPEEAYFAAELVNAV